MRYSYVLYNVLAVLILLNVRLQVGAFGVLPTKTSIDLCSRCTIIAGRRNKSCQMILFSEGNNEEKKTKKLDSIADPADIEDLPIFSLEYNADNVDYSQLPVPPFTSALILLASTAFTIYLYYVGITGGVATAPGP
mmetsp:Transcript_3781/g.9914  ORF Transcript_3781/g.9914 Transcript_3781/m.9914 type:complete len:136 (+) Transcript_3781:138-545(+)